MLTIVCGEDSAGSRKHVTEMRSKLISENKVVQNILASELIESTLYESQNEGLFGSEVVYITQGLSKYLSRHKGKDTKEKIEEASKSPTHIIDWEEGIPARDVRSISGKVVEFKPGKTIFNLLDSFVPGNKQKVILLLHGLAQEQEEGFILIMISRHIRSLILAKSNLLSKNTSPWQAVKLKKQASLWTEQALLAFYEGLHRLDISMKTSANVYGIVGSLDILAIHYL